MTNPNAGFKEFHQQITVIDLHVHPSLKTFLWNKNLAKRHRTGGAWNPLTLRVDLPKIKDGGVDVLFSSVYLPERRMIKDCFILDVVTSLLGKKFRSLKRGDPFEITQNILQHFEIALEDAASKKGNSVEIARSFTELKRVLSEGKTAVIHSVEGAHSLAGRLENVENFFQLGVSLITLAHFYENEVTHTVGGIPEEKKFLGCFKNEKEQTAGLTDFGKQAVEKMLDIGMLIDLTHCTPKARQEIYEINNGRRPLVFSHTGVYDLNSATMNPTDEEIKAIADCGGVIGVIFMNFWLYPHEQKNGLDLILRTIQHLKNVGGIECIAIGSDFDGFTDPPDDIKDISEMPKLTEALLKAGFNQEEIEKIWGKNVLRVLEYGWGMK
ncbi:MAG: hypothetical protein Kow0042_22870 [Calditrichia bacterium]